MEVLKKSFFLITLLSLLQLVLLLSCSDDDCGPFPNRFKTIGIALQNTTLSNPEAEPAFYSFVPVSSQEVLKEDEYYIELSPVKQNYTAFNTSPDFSLLANAYACSPQPPRSDETIKTLNIFANLAIDDQHPAGANLSGLFDVLVVDHYNSLINQRMSLSEFLASNPNVKDKLYLVLNSPIKEAGAYRFEILFKTTLGEVETTFTEETHEVMLEPSL